MHCAPASACTPQEAAQHQVARVPTAYLEHLEGKMRPGPPPQQDKRLRSRPSQLTAGETWTELKENGDED